MRDSYKRINVYFFVDELQWQILENYMHTVNLSSIVDHVKINPLSARAVYFYWHLTVKKKLNVYF